MPVQGRIRYALSPQGQRDSLKKGGDGRRTQEIVGSVGDADLDAFPVDENGQLFFDASSALDLFMDTSAFMVPGQKGQILRSSTGSDEIQWHVVPSWEDLVQVARQVKAWEDEMWASGEEYQQRKARAAKDFLDDPAARATTLDDHRTVIGGYPFRKDEAAAVEARKRWERDQEELKKANRATLAKWVSQHGTENQRARLAAGLLPWKEAYETVETHLFAPLSECALYRRFEIAEVCICRSDPTDSFCKVKFKSTDATELTANEWERLTVIKALAPEATFQLREHEAECASDVERKLKRGVIVKFALGHLTFKREFAL